MYPEDTFVPMQPWAQAVAADRVRKNGWLIFEFGFGQAPAIREIIAKASAWHLEKLREDLQGLPRTAVLRRA